MKITRLGLSLAAPVLAMAIHVIAAEPPAMTVQKSVSVEKAASFLAKHHGRLRSAVYRYDGRQLLNTVNTDMKLDCVNPTIADGRWQIAVPSAAVDERRGVADFEVNFRLLEGAAPQTAVGVELSFDRWSKDNYVVMPGSVYNGNRFRIRPMNYAPFLTDPKDLGPNIPVTVIDIPHLATGTGPSEIQEQTGNLATPALGWQSPSLKQGFWLLTTQGSKWGNHGINIRESDDRKQCKVEVVAPRMRAKRATINGPVDSQDRAPDWRPGDEASIRVRLHFFPAPAIQSLFDRFADIRKELLSGAATAPSVPMSVAWQAVERTLNEHHWDDSLSLYRNGVQLDQGKIAWASGKLWHIFSVGWCGGAMNTHALLAAGNDTSKQRAWQNLDRIITRSQGPSGFYYTYTDGSRWLGDGVAKRYQPTDPNLILARRSADALYFFLKQIMLLEHGDPARPCPPAWKEHVKRLADAFVTLWKREGQFGQYLNVETGDIKIGATSSAAIAPAALALAADYFKNPQYLDVACAAARQYYERDVRAGYTTGAPGDALQAPDYESAYHLLESFVVLYEATGEAEWLRYAGEQAKQFMTWVVSYEYAWPQGSTCARLAMPTTGTMWANAQNKCAVAGVCTASADAFFKLYRFTGDARYLELMREIYRAQSRWVSLPDRPFPGWAGGKKFVDVPAGWIWERVQMGDWEEPGAPVGEIPLSTAIWAQSAILLAWVEVPGLYVQPDTGFVCAFDHIEATGRKTPEGFKVAVHNPTRYPAKVRMLCESSADAKKPLGVNAPVRCRVIELAAGERKEFSCDSKQNAPPATRTLP